jgi:thiamine biosynthesis lipoprotein
MNTAFRRVEHHMSTAITLGGEGLDDDLADAFFARVRVLEGLLSRYRPDSQISLVAAGELPVEDADPAVREVLARCEGLRAVTHGDFDHQPRLPTGPLLDVNALAKGWIIEEAAIALRMSGAEFFVNAGGDVTTTRRAGGRMWRVGVQHPDDRAAVLGVFEVAGAAVATSGTYERGEHIRRAGPPALVSVTVVGPDLGEADALSTAVFASGQCPPSWWDDVGDRWGLLALTSENRLRWIAPKSDSEIAWHFPNSARTGSPQPAPGPPIH